MKDRLLTYAIGISVVLHLVGVCVVARTSASRLNAAPEKPQQQRLMKVDLVRTPDEAAKPKPKPVVPKVVRTPKPQPRPEPHVNQPKPIRNEPPTHTPEPPRKTHVSQPRPAQQPVKQVTPRKAASQPAGDPGGKLNVGSTSAQGDLGGNWAGGKTGPGWVPGDDNGKGQGSGSGVGVGTPDPPRHADPGPGTRPAPKPEPPAPKMVSVRVCNVSGLRPNKYCTHTHSESFVDGSEPSRTCDRCKVPEPEPKHVSKLAKSSEAKLISDPYAPQAPMSIPEGRTLKVTLRYTCTNEGKVTDISVVKSSGYRAVDKEAIKAASKRRYKPAMQNGEPRSETREASWVVKT